MVLHSTDGRIRMRGDTVPLTDGGFDLGTSSIEWGDAYIQSIYASTHLKVPHGSGDPSSPVNGEIWVNTSA